MFFILRLEWQERREWDSSASPRNDMEEKCHSEELTLSCHSEEPKATKNLLSFRDSAFLLSVIQSPAAGRAKNLNEFQGVLSCVSRSMYSLWFQFGNFYSASSLPFKFRVIIILENAQKHKIKILRVNFFTASWGVFCLPSFFFGPLFHTRFTALVVFLIYLNFVCQKLEGVFGSESCGETEPIFLFFRCEFCPSFVSNFF